MTPTTTLRGAQDKALDLGCGMGRVRANMAALGSSSKAVAGEISASSCGDGGSVTRVPNK